MSRLVLIIVAGGYLLYGITNLMLNRNVLYSTNLSYESYSYGQVRNTANSVAQMVLSKLADNPKWRTTFPQKISLFGGTATYTVVTVNNSNENNNNEDNNHHHENENEKNNHENENEMNHHEMNHHDNDGENDDNDGLNNNNNISSNLIKISVTATYNNITRSVIVYASLPKPKATVPKFMNYALLTQRSIAINGNVKILDDNNPSWNANVHTNSNFSMNGNNKIKGFVTYSGNMRANPSWRLNTEIVPNQNSKNLPHFQQTSLVKIPLFIPDNFRSKATTVYNSNAIFNKKNIILGTKNNPKIIYVNGNLTISGNVTGYGVFIVRGNINLSGNITINAEDPSGSNLGLYTSGNINVSGNVILKAQIFANQNLNFSGNVKVYGSITTRGASNFSGNISIFYKPANANLTSQFWNNNLNNTITDNFGFAKKRLKINAWYE